MYLAVIRAGRPDTYIRNHDGRFAYFSIVYTSVRILF